MNWLRTLVPGNAFGLVIPRLTPVLMVGVFWSTFRLAESPTKLLGGGLRAHNSPRRTRSGYRCVVSPGLPQRPAGKRHDRSEATL